MFINKINGFSIILINLNIFINKKNDKSEI